MPRVNYSFTALIDEDVGGGNIVAAQAITVKNQIDGTYPTLYANETGATTLSNPGSVTDANGVFEFWIDPGIYTIESGTRTEIEWIDDGTRTEFLTVTDAAASKQLRAGDVITIAERYDAKFTTIAGTGTANTHNVIASTVASLSYSLIIDEVVNLDEYVNNAASASAGINLAAASAVSNGKALVSYDRSVTYVLNAGVPIDLSSIKYIDIKGKIDTTALDSVTTTGCIIAGELSLSTGGNWKFGDIISSNPGSSFVATDYPQLRIQGAKGIHMEFGNIQYLQFHMDYTGGGGSYTRSGNAYNQMFFSSVVAKFEVDSITVSGDPLWFNENVMTGGRFIKVFFRDNGYIHNHNKFERPLFETSDSEIRWEIGSSNEIIGARFESNANTLAISAITKANPAVVTAAANNYTAGDEIYIYNVGGMVEIEDGWYTLGAVTSTTMELSGINSTGYNTYTSSGFTKKPTLYMGDSTYVNRVERSWISGLSTRELAQDPFLVTAVRDLGHGNDWAYTKKQKSNPVEMFSFSGEQTVFCSGVVAGTDSATSSSPFLFSQPRDRRNVGGSRGFYPSLVNSYFPGTFTSIAETPMIPVINGDAFAFFVKASSGGVRFHAYTYDAAGLPLDVPGASQSSTLAATDSNSYFSSSQMNTYAADGSWITTLDYDGTEGNSNSEFNPSVNCAIRNDAIKFIKFKCTIGGVATLLESCSGIYYEPIKGNPRARAALGQDFSDMYLTGEPAMGFAQRGMKVYTDEIEYQCTFSIFTTLNGALSSGATSVTVDDITDDAPYNDLTVEDGDIVAILLNDGSMTWREVASLSTKTFSITSLSSPAGTSFSGNAAEDGATVFLCRWIIVQGKPDGNKSNTSLGHNAGAEVGTISSSVCVGASAGIRARGTQNTIVGRTAGVDVQGDNNTVIGANAVSTDTSTGDSNTAIGTAALANLTLGWQNTAVGESCGSSIEDGFSNTIIGYNSEPSGTLGNNQIVIGNSISGTSNNQFSFGKYLNVVSNDYNIDALWSRSSDVRKKTKIVDSRFGLDFITKLRPVEFEWKPEWGEPDIEMTGFIAQEVEAALEGDTFIGHKINPGEEGYQVLKIEAFIPVLVNAVKELAARLEELEGDN